MKIHKLPLLVSILALAFAPIVSAQTVNPVPGANLLLPPTITPLTSDVLRGARQGSYGNATEATFALWQLEQLFPPVAGPGILVTPVGGTTGLFNVALQLINSPTTALGYYTGVGTGQTVTQLTNKSTAVIMPAACYTGTITMNNASLATNAVVKFTVTDTAVAASDVVIAVPQQGSITAAAAYFITCNSNNGSFVVNIDNLGTTESDAIILNFIVLRASGN